MCTVLIYAQSYIAYWMQQEPKPHIKKPWLVWDEHKWGETNCLRCGARKERAK